MTTSWILRSSDVCVQARNYRKIPRRCELYRALYGEDDIRTFDYKWLRAVGNSEATGCHIDHVYMGADRSA